MQTYSEAMKNLINGAAQVAELSETPGGQLLSNWDSFAESWDIDMADWFYEPDHVLKKRVADYLEWCNKRSNEDAGRLMEEIAYLAFRCLKGANSPKSYQSYAAQHDLVITGSKWAWFLLMQYLHLRVECREIVVEAKNLDKTGTKSGKITDPQFSRLCGILQNKFDRLAELGVFVSRFGATGFPSKQNSRMRALRDCQATQVLFHAKTSKFVVVLDHEDIIRLTEVGSLPRILEAKIRAVEEWTGLPLNFDEEFDEIDLPPHLAQYM